MKGDSELDRRSGTDRCPLIDEVPLPPQSTTFERLPLARVDLMMHVSLMCLLCSLPIIIQGHSSSIKSHQDDLCGKFFIRRRQQDGNGLHHPGDSCNHT